MKRKCLPFFGVLYVSALIFVLFAYPAYAGGGGITGGATELTQIANNAELVAIYGKNVQQVLNQVEQISNQVKQYQEMLVQAKQLPDRLWADATKQLNNLESLYKDSKGLASGYGNMEKAVKDALDRSKKSAQTPSEARKESLETAQANTETTAKAMDNSVKEMNESAKLIEQMQQRSASAEGRMQALQAGNELAALTAQELVKLRTDLYEIKQEIINQNTEALNQKRADDEWREQEFSKPIPTSNIITFK